MQYDTFLVLIPSPKTREHKLVKLDESPRAAGMLYLYPIRDKNDGKYRGGEGTKLVTCDHGKSRRPPRVSIPRVGPERKKMMTKTKQKAVSRYTLTGPGAPPRYIPAIFSTLRMVQSEAWYKLVPAELRE